MPTIQHVADSTFEQLGLKPVSFELTLSPHEIAHNLIEMSKWDVLSIMKASQAPNNETPYATASSKNQVLVTFASKLDGRDVIVEATRSFTKLRSLNLIQIPDLTFEFVDLALKGAFREIMP